MKKFALSFAAPFLAVGLAAPATAQIINEGVGDASVVPITPVVPDVAPGSAEWIAINWTALGGDARELKVTAVGSEGVEVGYPAYPVDGYSSGYWDDTLSAAEIDYTALKLTVDADAPAIRTLTVTVRYVSDTGPKEDVHVMPLAPGVDPGTTITTAPSPSTTAPSTTAPSTTVAPSTTTEAAQPPVVTRFVLVDAAKDVDLREIVDGDTVSLKNDGGDLSIRVEAVGAHESMELRVTGRDTIVENREPYSITSTKPNDPNDYYSWVPKKDRTYTVVATPYAQDGAQGVAGTTASITFDVVK